MKTIYLFIIILTFIMTSPYALACGGGGGGGEGGSGSDNSVSAGAMSAAPTISFYTPPNAVQCSWNIHDDAQRELDKQKADPGKADKRFNRSVRRATNHMTKNSADQSKRTKNIRTMVTYIKLLLLTETGARGDDRINRALYVLAVLLANDRAHSYN